MKIEILKISKDGTGEFVAHLDDGSSFSQSFTQAPVDDPDATIRYLTKLSDQVVARNTPAAKPDVAPTVEALIGRQVDPIRSLKEIK